MTKTIPAHLMSVGIDRKGAYRLREMRMPDWGLSFGKSKKIPTEEEIVAKFDRKELIRIAYTSSLLVRLLRYFVIDEVVFNLKYPRRPEFKKHTRLLQQLCDELEREARKAHHHELIKYLDDCFDRFRKECRGDLKKLRFATLTELMRNGKDSDDVRIGIATSLLVIAHINRHGSYISRVICERSGLEPQEFQPSQSVTLSKAVLVKMADMLDCKVEASEAMGLGLEILTKRYLEILDL